MIPSSCAVAGAAAREVKIANRAVNRLQVEDVFGADGIWNAGWFVRILRKSSARRARKRRAALSISRGTTIIITAAARVVAV